MSQPSGQYRYIGFGTTRRIRYRRNGGIGRKRLAFISVVNPPGKVVAETYGLLGKLGRLRESDCFLIDGLRVLVGARILCVKIVGRSRRNVVEVIGKRERRHHRQVFRSLGLR